MPERKRAIHTDLAKLDAHEVQPEEYEDIPELTDEFFDNAEIRLGGRAAPNPKTRRSSFRSGWTRISSSASAPPGPAGNRGSTPHCANTFKRDDLALTQHD